MRIHKPSPERVRQAVAEEVALVPYDPTWPDLFRREAEHLRAVLPSQLIRRIEHFGSTAVPGLAAKPVIDMLVEVAQLRATRREIVPILVAEGYDYFWRPTFGDDVPPWYAFFIKRKANGVRTHHLHLITRRPAFRAHWDRLLFRDSLRAHPGLAAEYQRVKLDLAARHPHDRVAYTEGKTEFILRAADACNEPVRGAPSRETIRRTRRSISVPT